MLIDFQSPANAVANPLSKAVWCTVTSAAWVRLPSSMASTSGTERWVAIVDDDESIRRAFARLLRAHGIEVRTFQSAKDFLNRVPGDAPACLCIDLFLGEGMNGFKLVEILRAQGITSPIVFFTGHDAREFGPMMGEQQRDVVILRKPFEAQQLLDLVIEQLRTRPTNEVS